MLIVKITLIGTLFATKTLMNKVDILSNSLQIL